MKKLMGKGSNAIFWHLSVLIKFGCVQVINYKNANLFAVAALNPQEVLITFITRKKLALEIFRQLMVHPCSLGELEENLSEAKIKIQYHLRNLEELEFIVKEDEGNEVSEFPRFIINPNFQAVISKTCELANNPRLQYEGQ